MDDEAIRRAALIRLGTGRSVLRARKSEGPSILFPRHLAATGPARRVDVTRRPSCCQFTNLGAPTAADAAPTFHHQYAFLELGRPHRPAPAREAGPK
jgi:hypothetical protein